MSEALEDLRRRIDEIDASILELLIERARVAAQVGRAKSASDSAVYAPNREAELLRALTQYDLGPLGADSVEAVFREVVSACRGLQQVPSVAFLGPEHTFTHLAARKRFGHKANFLPVGTIDDVFDAIEREQADFGIVPIQNSTEGVVGATLDCLLDTPLRICAELYVQVHHFLAGGGSLDDFQNGAIYRASYSPSDFSLVELEEMPDPAWNVTYSGWDRGDADPVAAVAIHHPSTDEKAIRRFRSVWARQASEP